MVRKAGIGTVEQVLICKPAPPAEWVQVLAHLSPPASVPRAGHCHQPHGVGHPVIALAVPLSDGPPSGPEV
eukprot:7369248-Lingulodinium_polyedra.AAC.1